MAARLVETTGEVPSPRVGHRSVLVDGSLIVWGGITALNGPNDNSIYSLNLLTYNWRRLDIQPAPSARALHVACMCGEKLMVFGGAVSGNRVLDDLWSVDLSSRAPKWERIRISLESRSPPARGGHAMAAHQNKLYLFGGSNDKTLYNDIWCFDVSTRVWTELRFMGSIPPPRAYHALSLVGDVVYLFGGCGEDWMELGDAWSFKISDQRWGVCWFWGGNGEINQSGDTTIVNILDTSLINYPKNRDVARPSSMTHVKQSQLGESDPLLSYETTVAPSQYTIAGSMPISKIFRNLVIHGCHDASKDLDISRVSEYPVSSGGFGDVYCATLRNGDRVGLKCLRMLVGSTEEGKKFLKRAAHELYVWSKCKHPNILELSGIMLFRGRIAMVSPWVDNGHLRWFLSQDPQVDRCALSAQIVDGVDYLHGQGIVHGDLKPENVSRGIYTTVHEFKYYTQYISTVDEILKEETKTTQAGDIFALGMIIFETITGIIPYAGSSDPVVMFSIASGKLPDRPQAHIPIGVEQADRLWSAITSCWAYSPNERPKAREVRSQLDGITSGDLPTPG
ncbi:hypothetical protein OPQ81_003246 [Rhizoctonia solani]|nr:hypothetical protein OPQ81_003246 [Rhizoctonia solani]